MCGATRWRNLRQRVVSGLSPRVRGNLLKFGFVSGRHRSIPACAGQPKTLKGWRYQLAVYPRVCGATLITEFQEAWMRGLSPRVRGNHCLLCELERYTRSIPACAGQPTYSNMQSNRTRVYPRVCGATRRDAWPTAPDCGLSPRVRGNRLDGGALLRRSRSIPACAGQPIPVCVRVWLVWVYPRVCGATEVAAIAGLAYVGLSPRVRGNLDRPALKPLE